MVLGSPTDPPIIHIKFIQKLLRERSRQGFGDAHGNYATALFGAFLVFVVFVSNTSTAEAFWPFFTEVQAQTNGVIPSSDTPTLTAPINSDPTPPGPSTLATTEGTALIANQGPDGVPSEDVVVTPASTQISTYVVKQGDTLSQIAQNKNVTVDTILWANDLTSTDTIRPGETLVILPVTGVEHTVVKGDTLASVAKKYGGAASDIANENGLDPEAPLVVGSQLIIPNGELGGTTESTGGSSGATSSGGEQSNPYRGGSGPEIDGYYENPVPGAILTQGLHGENAVDLGIARNTPIGAAAAGTVIIARDNGAWNGGYGNYVVIAHPNGTETLYAHMSRTAVTVGQSVAQAEVIGYVGMTGDATGPHVHFEVRGAVNPFAVCTLGTHVGAFSCGD